MRKMSELAYDIEQLYIEGMSPKSIARVLECPLEVVYQWIEECGVDATEEDLDPYNTINS